jgi:hypothetical protein
LRRYSSGLGSMSIDGGTASGRRDA